MSAPFWLVIGAGVSGKSAATFLAHRGDRVRLCDRLPVEKNTRAVLVATKIEVADTREDLELLKDITHVCLSPGVPPSLPLVVEAKKRGLTFATEIDLGLEGYRGNLVAVTGTNGKSTTCVMIEHLFKKLGVEARAGGNLGEPPTAIAYGGPLPKNLILELSSYQLEMSKPLAAKVAMITSFSHDHLQRHGTIEKYLETKWKVFEAIPTDGLALIPSYIWHQANKLGLKLPGCSTKMLELSFSDEALGLELSGQTTPHDQLNATFAIYTVAHLTGKPLKHLAALLHDFRGLPYRCEKIGTVRGNAIINDSKSTNVESTLAALKSVSRPCLLMLGGQSKDESFIPIATARNKIIAAYVFGASSQVIEEDLKDLIPVRRFETLKAAMPDLARALKAKPSPVLFSPGCASFDEFKNFEHRGTFFNDQMRPLLDPVTK